MNNMYGYVEEEEKKVTQPNGSQKDNNASDSSSSLGLQEDSPRINVTNSKLPPFLQRLQKNNKNND
jgi:hypothetical protein